jgi:2,3-bisphosphoglycerate-independent phosphoglycerate mutase
MKYCIVIADGAADYPVAELGGKTPLQVAEKPNMDRMASEGLLGQVRTVPDRMWP